jgi:acetoin utilization deacetylase AcuC-like enzyme
LIAQRLRVSRHADLTTTDQSSDRSSGPLAPPRPWFRIYYNDVYEVYLPPNHRFPMQKYRMVREMLQARIQRGSNGTADDPSAKTDDDDAPIVPSVDYEFIVSPLATLSELETTHDPTYVDRFVKGLQTPAEIRNVGFPWSPEGVDRALSSTGGTVAAACAVVEESLRRKRLGSSPLGRSAPCWSAHVAGGTHHAFYDYGEGFCVFSDIAVAANVVRERYAGHVRNVLVLDLDVHQGNGNAVLFENRDDVFTFSMHCSANYFSPKRTSDLDIELPPGCTDETYLITLHHWLQKLKLGGDFDLIFYQAGVDVLECDRLGQLALSPRGVRRRNRLVYDFCLDLGVPLVITMGGGYPRNASEWTPIIEAHCDVYWQAHQVLANVSRESVDTPQPRR